MAAMSRLEATVHGYVQGVGYRYFVRRKAGELGLAAQAENLPDGTVHVTAEGERTALLNLIEQLREGPVASRVARVEHDITD